ncbi:MAG: hypothetical protein R3C60_13220 [Parvularculaceae bacterium]
MISNMRIRAARSFALPLVLIGSPIPVSGCSNIDVVPYKAIATSEVSTDALSPQPMKEENDEKYSTSSSAKSSRHSTKNYTITRGEENQLCQEFASLLNRLPPRPKILGNNTCFPPLPKSGNLSLIQFAQLDPNENLDLIKEIELEDWFVLNPEEKREIDSCLGDQECLDKLWVERDWLSARAMRIIESGLYRLQRAQVDFDNDGTLETVYLTRNYAVAGLPGKRFDGPNCTLWGDGIEEPDLRIYFRQQDEPELHKRFRYGLLTDRFIRYERHTYLVTANNPTFSINEFFRTRHRDGEPELSSKNICYIHPTRPNAKEVE